MTSVTAKRELSPFGRDSMKHNTCSPNSNKNAGSVPSTDEESQYMDHAEGVEIGELTTLVAANEAPALAEFEQIPIAESAHVVEKQKGKIKKKSKGKRRSFNLFGKKIKEKKSSHQRPMTCQAVVPPALPTDVPSTVEIKSMDGDVSTLGLVGVEEKTSPLEPSRNEDKGRCTPTRQNEKAQPDTTPSSPQRLTIEPKVEKFTVSAVVQNELQQENKVNGEAQDRDPTIVAPQVITLLSLDPAASVESKVQEGIKLKKPEMIKIQDKSKSATSVVSTPPVPKAIQLDQVEDAAADIGREWAFFFYGGKSESSQEGEGDCYSRAQPVADLPSSDIACCDDVAIDGAGPLEQEISMGAPEEPGLTETEEEPAIAGKTGDESAMKSSEGSITLGSAFNQEEDKKTDITLKESEAFITLERTQAALASKDTVHETYVATSDSMDLTAFTEDPILASRSFDKSVTSQSDVVQKVLDQDDVGGIEDTCQADVTKITNTVAVEDGEDVQAKLSATGGTFAATQSAWIGVVSIQGSGSVEVSAPREDVVTKFDAESTNSGVDSICSKDEALMEKELSKSASTNAGKDARSSEHVGHLQENIEMQLCNSTTQKTTETKISALFGPFDIFVACCHPTDTAQDSSVYLGSNVALKASSDGDTVEGNAIDGDTVDGNMVDGDTVDDDILVSEEDTLDPLKLLDFFDETSPDDSFWSTLDQGTSHVASVLSGPDQMYKNFLREQSVSPVQSSVKILEKADETDTSDSDLDDSIFDTVIETGEDATVESEGHEPSTEAENGAAMSATNLDDSIFDTVIETGKDATVESEGHEPITEAENGAAMTAANLNDSIFDTVVETGEDATVESEGHKPVTEAENGAVMTAANEAIDTVPIDISSKGIILPTDENSKEKVAPKPPDKAVEDIGRAMATLKKYATRHGVSEPELLWKIQQEHKKRKAWSASMAEF